MNSIQIHSNRNNRPRLLFLGSGPIYPTSIPVRDKFAALSQHFSGEIISPIIGNYDVEYLGDFQLYSYKYWRQSTILRNIYSFVSIIFMGIKSSVIRGQFDVIITTNPLMIGMAGYLLAKIVRSRLVVEINGDFHSSLTVGSPESVKPMWIDRIKSGISKWFLIPTTTYGADMVKLVYHKQIAPLRLNEGRIRSVSFPNFVSIKRFSRRERRDDRYILSIGYPWYLKGMDVLINAFNRISHKFPHHRLKIIGWCPEGREYFEQLASVNKRIDLLDAVQYEQVIEYMTRCTLYVLASRTDSSPRVLREAMASRKPIIASNIDGVPDLITDGYNGLLFESENVLSLSESMEQLLSNNKLAQLFANNGYSYVQKNLSEDVYIENYQNLITAILE